MITKHQLHMQLRLRYNFLTKSYKQHRTGGEINNSVEIRRVTTFTM